MIKWLAIATAAAMAYLLISRRVVVQLKEGVVMALSAEMAAALPLIEDVYQARTGRALVITSANDSTHSIGSLHYTGNALDLRVRDPAGTWSLSTEERNSVVQLLRQALGTLDFDTLLESDHIHVEYQPVAAGGSPAV